MNHPHCFDSLEYKEWLEGALNPAELEKLSETWRSPKFIIMAHIIAMAIRGGEKTLVFSKCLKTLKLIETFFQSDNWAKHVTSLKDDFSDLQLGKWKKNQDYLRIDGSTEIGKRGSPVRDFKTKADVRVFLISSVAGGIGINLVSQNRSNKAKGTRLSSAERSLTNSLHWLSTLTLARPRPHVW